MVFTATNKPYGGIYFHDRRYVTAGVQGILYAGRSDKTVE